MNPVLYDASEMSFTSMGIGALADAHKVTIKRVLNGVDELEMVYPVGGAFFTELEATRQILAMPEYKKTPQAYRIYQVTKPMNGFVTVLARHISERRNYLIVEPFEATDLAHTLTMLPSKITEQHPFTFYTDKSVSTPYKRDLPSSLGSVLGGTAGSLLDLYGGEYEFDMYQVRLLSRRGMDRGVSVAYGKNLTKLEVVNAVNESVVTSICPVWMGEEEQVYLPEYIIDGPYVSAYPYRRAMVVDFSGDFEEAPTESQLRAAANSYITRNAIGAPIVSLKVSFEHLAQYEEYRGIAVLETLNLGDTVTIQHNDLGVDVSARIVETVFDALHEKYNSVTIGRVQSNMSSTLKTIETTVDKKIKENKSLITEAVANATDLIAGAKGGNVIMNKDSNGKPYEILIMDTADKMTATNVIRINQNGIGFSRTGYNGPFLTAWTIDGAFVADFITAGTLSGDRVRTGLISDVSGQNYWNLNTGEWVNKSISERLDNMQAQIDDDIQTYSGADVPTLNNYPANEWTTAADKDGHVGDLYIVTEGEHEGSYYRFLKNGNTYQWKLLEDTEVARALAEAEDALRRVEIVETEVTNLGGEIVNRVTTTQMQNYVSSATSAAVSEAEGYTDNKLGSYSTTIETESMIKTAKENIELSVSRTYTTKQDFANLAIGGRNYAWAVDSNMHAIRVQQCTYTYNPDNNGEYVLVGGSGNNSQQIWHSENGVYGYDVPDELKGQTLLFHADHIEASGASPSPRVILAFLKNNSNLLTTSLSDTILSRTLTVPDDAEKMYILIRIRQNQPYINGETLTVRGIKLEKGNKATDWTPAPEDAKEQIARLDAAIQVFPGQIASKVSQQDYNGNMIASLINQTSTTVLINASQIDLQGALTIGSFDPATQALLVKNTTTKNQYAQSNSATTAPTSGWRDDIPAYSASRKYIWMRVATTKTFANNTTQTTYSDAVVDTNLTKAVEDAATAASTASGAASAASTASQKATAAESAANTATAAVNASVKGAQVQYYKSTSSTSLSGGSWQTTSPTWENGYYIWTRTKWTQNDGTETYSTASCITGNTGAKGATGAAGAKGDKGDTGAKGDKGDKGDAGKGVKTITNYYAVNNSTTAPADSAFGTSVVSPTTANRYLWNYEKITYTDDSTTNTNKHIMAVYGQTGATGPKGDTGAAGKGISDIAEYYALSSATTAPADSAFSTSVPTMTTTNKYLWNFEKITYSDSTTENTAKRIIGVYGTTGATGKGITSVTELYYCSNSPTAPAAPTATVTVNSATEYNKWNKTCPIWTETYKYYYTCVEIKYTNNTYGWSNVSENNALNAANENANTAKTTANKNVRSTVSCYYRSTTDATPTINASTTINATESSTDANNDNKWFYVLLKPKKNAYFFTCERYTYADGTVGFSTVRPMNNLTVTSLWCSSNDKTYIDGANIYAGSVTANQMAANSITAEKIAAGAVTANKIASDEVLTQKLTASDFYITGGRININTGGTSFDVITLTTNELSRSVLTPVGLRFDAYASGSFKSRVNINYAGSITTYQAGTSNGVLIGSDSPLVTVRNGAYPNIDRTDVSPTSVTVTAGSSGAQRILSHNGLMLYAGTNKYSALIWPDSNGAGRFILGDGASTKWRTELTNSGLVFRNASDKVTAKYANSATTNAYTPSNDTLTFGSGSKITCRKTGIHGIVSLYFYISNGDAFAKSTDYTIFTLPTDYRPAYKVMATIPNHTGNTALLLTIETTGVMTVYRYASSGASATWYVRAEIPVIFANP